MKVSWADVTPAPSFHKDPAGSVFYYRGEVYRGIRPAYEDFYRNLLTADFFPKLVEAGLVDTEISDLTVEGFPLVLRHRKIEFESVWGEWCSWMIQDATALMLELSLALAKRGLFLSDIKPGNVLFDSARPVWIDLGAVVPLKSVNRRQWLRRLWQNSIFPLWLMSKGMHDMGRLIYQEVPGQGLQDRIARPPWDWFPLYFRRLASKSRRKNFPAILAKLLRYVRGLELKPRGGVWIKYREGIMPRITDPGSFNAKQENVFRVLKELPKGTLMDIGCNKGWYSELAASLGHRVLAFDTDNETICHLYRSVKANNLPILPLIMDFAWPTPNYGLGLGGRDAFERLRCDVTLGLALVHHLVFRNHLRFETIAWILDRFTRSCAIVDFPPKEDITVAKWIRPGLEWYTLDHFVAALKPYFPKIALYQSDPTPRQLLVCRRS